MDFSFNVLFELLSLFYCVIDELVDKVTGEHQNSDTDKEWRKCRIEWVMWEEKLVCEIPDASPEEYDGRTHEECFDTTFPEFETSMFFSKYSEIHRDY